MRIQKFLSVHISLLALSSIIAVGTPIVDAQRAIAPTDLAASRSEVNAYRTLFRRARLYKKLADEAERSSQPKPHLRLVLAYRYSLNNADTASLERIALAYENALAPLQKQRTSLINVYHARFSVNVIQPGTEKTPPPELTDVQAAMDATTLLYRDLLRNSMRPEDFQSPQPEACN